MAHISVASFCTQIDLLLVLIFLTTGSSGPVFSLEEEFLQLKANYNQMKEIVKNLESKVIELELKDAQMQEKIIEQDLVLTSLLREKNERTAAAADFDFASINQSASSVAINGLPSSCSDLKTIGHTLNGFYSIMGSAMMESVFCDFSKIPNDTGFQKWIGYADIKSTPVNFYVRRNSNFDLMSTPISFELAQTNEGNAMDLTSGIFTVPKTGTYFFSFTGMASFPATSSSSEVYYLQIGLYLNGGFIGTARTEDTNTYNNQWSPLSTLQSILNVNSGDQVWLEITDMSPGAYLVDSPWYTTHFTGFMLQEEIMASIN